MIQEFPKHPSTWFKATKAGLAEPPEPQRPLAARVKTAFLEADSRGSNHINRLLNREGNPDVVRGRWLLNLSELEAEPKWELEPEPNHLTQEGSWRSP